MTVLADLLDVSAACIGELVNQTREVFEDHHLHPGAASARCSQARDLGDVTRGAIGNVVRETRPLLQQHGHLPTPATIRYRTAAELLTAISPSQPDTPTN